MTIPASFKGAVSSWQDVDGVMYDLAIALGILEPGTPFGAHAKHVFWSNNELGNMLHDMLRMMAKIGVLEFNDDGDKCRWNPNFKWREASSRKGPI
jgi:hypothetical protein